MAKLISTNITMPPDLRHKLELEAARQTRSLSQQIVHMLSKAVNETEARESEAA